MANINELILILINLRYRLCYELALLYLISKDIILLCLLEFIKGTVSVISNSMQRWQCLILNGAGEW